MGRSPSLAQLSYLLSNFLQLNMFHTGTYAYTYISFHSYFAAQILDNRKAYF